MSDFYTTGSDPYCYPDSMVLINRFNFRDATVLKEVESAYSQARLSELYNDRPITGRFTLTHLQRIHRYIFRMCILGLGNSAVCASIKIKQHLPTQKPS